jgi:hypothetical protein
MDNEFNLVLTVKKSQIKIFSLQSPDAIIEMFPLKTPSLLLELLHHLKLFLFHVQLELELFVKNLDQKLQYIFVNMQRDY